MKWSIQINGKPYNNENLLSINDSEIRDFLEEWGNKELSISVKTSGSTGKPKLIHLLKSDMIASAELTGKYFKLENARSYLVANFFLFNKKFSILSNCELNKAA